MVKFNKGKVRAATPASAITTIPSEGVRTHQGGAGWARDTKSELMLLSVAYLPAEDTHYELGCARDSRFVPLIHQVALDDPEWGVRFLEYLRLDTRMRTAAVIGAAEFARARAVAGAHGHTRDAVDVVCQRADEPGELLAYWFANVGRKLPMPVKRGLAQAVWRLYTEWSHLKWDSTENPIRFADVIGLVRPTGTLADCDGTYPIKGTTRAVLYEYLRAARTAEKITSIPQELPKLRRHAELMSVPVEQRRTHLNAGELRAAGMTRESLAGWLQGPMDARAYECVAEGTPVWLPDGRVVPVERVISEQLPVLSYDHEWDMREPKMGCPVPPRDHSVGNLAPTVPATWIDSGERDVFAIRFASGREIRATAGHRWAARLRDGARRPLWRTTEQLQPGASVPVALDAGYFGSLGDELDGWFLGAMLGDGSMTGNTPAWTGQDDGTLEAVREFAAKHGCVTSAPEQQPGCVRVRITDPVWHRNAVRDELIAHGVWGMRVERKALADLPYSRAFVLGAIAGLIDSDGSVTGPGVEFAVTSERLARQFADMLLRIGVLSVLDTRPNGEGCYPLWRVRVSDSASVTRLASSICLRGDRKARALAALANRRIASRRTATGWRGYPDTIAWDRVVSITAAGRARTYCVEVHPSHLWVANGVVTGNCIIPSMGYTALVRNLRNFDQAGISDESAQQVMRILADEDNVRKSRMAPLQFLAAYREAPSLRWAWPLEQAINHSLGNVPQLTGNTLILVDTSSSMDNLLSAPSKVKRWDAAATFGIALATRCARVEVVSFSSTARYWGDPHNAHTKQFTVRPGESLLVAVQRWGTEGCFLGGGTATGAALRRHYTGHDRVVVLTDEQAGVDPVDVDHSIPANVPMYTLNLAGYAHGHGPSGTNRHTWGGLNDEMFNVIRLVEAGKAADWDRIFRTRRKQEDAA